ncbi:MAG: hypothetical protein IJ563_03985 [Selenomonadaceae bacterium]|nr:hypothetical protein [Selenomonadaceae bacterium]
MRNWKNILYAIFVMMIFLYSVGYAEEVKHYNIETGKSLGFPTYVVTYEISNPNIAEAFKAKNGEMRIRFNNPGDVYVRVIFYSGGKPADTLLYLFHVTGKPSGNSAVNQNSFAEEILNLVNQERSKYGLRPLKLAQDLNQYANIRARECVQLFSHTRPNGTAGVDIIPASTRKIAGENLSGGSTSPEQVMYEWMHSPTHRDNILFPDYDELGVGYFYAADSKYHHYWVQLFRRKK